VQEVDLMDTKETVLKVLKDSPEPLKAGDIAQKAGLDKKEVDKAIKALKKEEKIVSPKRCFYSKA
jgi:predicted Zn-ribbon and HTH transcriptional regulator